MHGREYSFQVIEKGNGVMKQHELLFILHILRIDLLMYYLRVLHLCWSVRFAYNFPFPCQFFSGLSVIRLRLVLAQFRKPSLFSIFVIVYKTEITSFWKVWQLKSMEDQKLVAFYSIDIWIFSPFFPFFF